MKINKEIAEIIQSLDDISFSELEKIWSNHDYEIMAEEKFVIDGNNLLLKNTGRNIVCPNDKICKILAIVGKEKLYEIEGFPKEREWEKMQERAESFKDQHIKNLGVDTVERKKFGKFVEATMTPIFWAIRRPQEYKIAKNERGNFSITLFDRALNGLDNIHDLEMAHFLIYSIYSDFAETKKVTSL